MSFKNALLDKSTKLHLFKDIAKGFVRIWSCGPSATGAGVVGRGFRAQALIFVCLLLVAAAGSVEEEVGEVVGGGVG